VPTIDEILQPYSTTYLQLPIVTDWSDGFPVREIIVDQGDALALAEALRQDFADTGIWPLIIDGDPEYETAHSIREHVEPGDGVEVGQAAIEASRGIDPLTLLPDGMKTKQVDTPAALQLMKAPQSIRSTSLGINMREGTGVLVELDPSYGHILLVPCDAPWESVVRVGFGACNCPPPIEQAAFLRCFAEGAGAEPLAINHDTLWIAMTRKVEDPAEAVRLARVFVRYCYELVDQGHEAVAAALRGGPSIWALWWD